MVNIIIWKIYSMRKIMCASTILCVAVSIGVCARCPTAALAPLSYVIEHAVWRGWHQAIIHGPDLEPDCQRALVRLVKCFSVNGIASSVNDLSKLHLKNKLGIVILLPQFRLSGTESISKLIKKLNELEQNTASYDWLLTTRYEQDFKRVNEILNASSVRFDQNIIVVYPFHKIRSENIVLGVCDDNFIYKVSNKINEDPSRRHGNRHRQLFYPSSSYCRKGDISCHKSEYERNYYKSTERFKNLTKDQTYKWSGRTQPLFQSGMNNYNNSRVFEMTNISKFQLKQQFHLWKRTNRYEHSEGKFIVQYFKVRNNSTLYACLLGVWNHVQSMSQVETPYPLEARTFLGEKLTVGRCNSSDDGSQSLDEDGPSTPNSLDDVLHFFTLKLNTTSKMRYYSKLGFRTYEGAWTGLLGALMDYSVDLALEPVTAHTARHQDMDFIFPIAETMCNIYIRHQETSTVRDIFLAPFSGRLVVCVVAVAVVSSLAIVLISRYTPSMNKDARPMGYMEALIWSTGILCQQGGTWTPPNPAGSLLLIVCLLFAVVTYNAYAAFITSVLSVRVASVDTVAAVLHSPTFKIGYIKNGADQMYLMSTKDAQLNAFYIRGYSDAENLVSTAEEGLARAASQDYAFFAGQSAARSTLRSLSQARGRCAVRELPVYSTRTQLAFPLPHRSPYARSILVSLLQLRSSGALARLEAALVPAMPQCAPPPGFASARAADVRSALIILVAGLVAAVFLGIFEYIWQNRRQLRKILLRFYRRVMEIIDC